MNLRGFEGILILAELALLAFVLVRARAMLKVLRRERQRGDDFLRALRTANREVTGGNRAVEIIIFELAMLHYALWVWGKGSESPGEPRSPPTGVPATASCSPAWEWSPRSSWGWCIGWSPSTGARSPPGC